MEREIDEWSFQIVGSLVSAAIVLPLKACETGFAILELEKEIVCLCVLFPFVCESVIVSIQVCKA